MLAALVQHHNDNETAPLLILASSGGRPAGTFGYGRHLTWEHSIPDEQVKQRRLELGAACSLRTLAAELTRRSWN